MPQGPKAAKERTAAGGDKPITEKSITLKRLVAQKMAVSGCTRTRMIESEAGGQPKAAHDRALPCILAKRETFGPALKGGGHQHHKNFIQIFGRYTRIMQVTS